MAEFIVGPTLFLVEKILSALHREYSKGNLLVEIEGYKYWLDGLKAYLKDNEGSEGSEAVKEDMKLVRDVTYDIKEILDISLLHLPHQHHMHDLSNKVHNVAHSIYHRGQLRDMSSKMKEVRKKIKIIQEMGTLGRSSGSSSMNQQEVMYAPEDGDGVVFEEPTEKLVDQLISKEPRCLSIAVVGPAGSGKTTLAKHVCDSSAVRDCFDCHALVHVSQKILDPVRLISNMLERFCASRDEPIPDGSGDVGKKLAAYLQRKSYVVLDNICSKPQWDFIKNVLRSGRSSCRSRIIVTTRNSDVGSYCADPGFGSVKHIHDLSCGLPGPQTWSLFCRIAFRDQSGKCPLELEEWSQKIVKRCEGLPFAIVAVGSMLSGLNRRLDPKELQNIHDNLGSKIRTSADLSSIRTMLSSSYQGAPSEKKICLLYFSIFPEDCSIRRGKLIRLWSAEGLVKRVDGKTQEETAEEYLDELVAKNLVHVSRRDFDGRAMSCRLQNLMLEFIVHKAEEEKVVLVSQKQPRSSQKVRRLSVQDSRTTLSECGDMSSVRSAFFFSWDKELKQLEYTLRNCFSLSVLDLEGAPVVNFPEAIVKLNLLKYLSLRDTKIKVIPKSIKKLSLLQTELPTDINNLRLLRHLFVRYNVPAAMTFDSFVIGVKMFTGIRNLGNLQKLSCVETGKNGNYVKELEGLTQLRKLGIILENGEDGSGLWLAIQKMAHLSTLNVSASTKEDYLALEFPGECPRNLKGFSERSQSLASSSKPPQSLERLYLKGRLKKFPEWISSLCNLYKIGLKWSRLRASPLTALQDMPNLMELEMVDAFTEDTLEFESGKFSKLKILHIERFDQLNTVIIRPGAMPHLQKLTLVKCEELRLLPFGIQQLFSLGELLLYAMHEDFINRLQKTNEDRLMVKHIPVIHSFTAANNSDWLLQNLS